MRRATDRAQTQNSGTLFLLGTAAVFLIAIAALACIRKYNLGEPSLWLIAASVLPCLLSYVFIRLLPGFRYLPAAVLLLAGILALLQIPDLSRSTGGMFSGFAAAGMMILGIAAVLVSLVTLAFTFVGTHLWRTPAPVEFESASPFFDEPAQPEAPSEPREFTLLQRSLDDTISREVLEEASLAAPQVTRSDSALIQRFLFGIIIRNLNATNANAFQSALRSYRVETDIVHNSELMTLPSPRIARGLRIEADAIIETDVYGRDHPYPRVLWALAAAGCIHGWTTRDERVSKSYVVRDLRGRSHVETETAVRTRGLEAETFRIELFIACEPYRIAWILEKDRPITLNGETVRLEDKDVLDAFLLALREQMPSHLVTRGIRLVGMEETPVYPNLFAFEEEITWQIYRSTQSQ